LSKSASDSAQALENVESNRLQQAQLIRNRLITIEKSLLTGENRRLQKENEKQKALADIDKELARLRVESVQSSKFGEVRKIEDHKMQKTLAEYKQQLAELNAKYQTARFWEIAFDKKSKSNSGFSSLRAHILEASVKDLNSIFEV